MYGDPWSWEYVTHYIDEDGNLQKMRTANHQRAQKDMRDLLIRGFCAWIIAVPWDDNIPF